MSTIFQRIAAGAALAVAPGLIALGAATTSHADTGTTTPGNYTVQTAPGHPSVGKPVDGSATIEKVRRHHRHRHHHYYYWS